MKDVNMPGYAAKPTLVAPTISTSSTNPSPLHQVTPASSSSFSCVSFTGLSSATVTSRLPVFLRSVRLSAASPLRTVPGPISVVDANNDEESLLLTSAHLSAHLRNPFLLACHGIVKSVQPQLFVYEYMQRGRLRNFLERELREVDEALCNANEYNSSLLSTKQLFKMLHQIVSGFEFLSQQRIPELVLDSSSVLVGADYTCKLEIAFWRNCLRQKTRNSDGRASFYVNNLGSLNSDLVGCLEVDGRDELESLQNAATSQRTAKISVTPFLTGAVVSQPTFSHLTSLENCPVRKCDSSTDNPLSLFKRLAKSVLSRSPPEAFTEYQNEPSHAWCYGCIQLEVLLAGVLYQQRVLRASFATDFRCPEQRPGLPTSSYRCPSSTSTSSSAPTPYRQPQPLLRLTQDFPTKTRQTRPPARARDDLLVWQQYQRIACKLDTVEQGGQPQHLTELREMLVVFVCDWFANDFLYYLLRGCLRENPSDRPALAEILRHLAKYAAENTTICRQPSYRIKSSCSGVLEQKHIPQETTTLAPASVAKDTQVAFITVDETEPKWKGLLVPELHLLGGQSS
ncbi:unnamed protein product [Schistocephalus solidus]|uniref:Tyrosine kinase receptor Cad96Ca n=1 Tax=Schistocephalus solidus TaxID=70667 RepID=A0A183SIN2_SCHSO|nr:unnamed protein product [Schistocephalus solidus]